MSALLAEVKSVGPGESPQRFVGMLAQVGS